MSFKEELEQCPERVRKRFSGLEETLNGMQGELARLRERVVYLEPFEAKNPELVEENEKLREQLREALKEVSHA